MSLLVGAANAIDQFRGVQAGRRQDRQLDLYEQQQNIRNTEEEERLLARTYGLAMGDLSQITGDITENGFGNVASYFENPEARKATAALINANTEKFNMSVGPDGKQVKGRITDFQPEMADDGSGNMAATGRYIPIITTEDGRTGPATEFRSTDSNDRLRVLSADEINSQSLAAYRAGITRGATENNWGLYVTGSRSQDNARKQKETVALREEMADKFSSDMSASETGIDPAELTDFVASINATTDIKKLREIATKMGIDVNALQAAAQAKADEDWETARQEGMVPGSIAELMQRNNVTETKWNNASPAEREQIIKDLQNMQTGTIAQAVGYVDREVSVLQDIVSAPLDSAINIWENFKTSGIGKRMGLSEVGEQSPGFSNEISKVITQGRNYQGEAETEALQERAERQKPVTEESISAVFDAPKQIELSEDNIREAIIKGTENPTNAQVQQVSTFLQENKISTDKEVVEAVKEGKVSKPDARQVAWVMGMTHDGTAADKAALTQKLLNGIERGDMDVGRKDQTAMEISAAQESRYALQARTAFNTYNLEYQKAQRGYGKEAQEFQTAKVQPFIEEVQVLAGIAKYVDGKFLNTAGDLKATPKTLKSLGRKIQSFQPIVNQAVDASQLAMANNAVTMALNLYAQMGATLDEGSFGQGWVDLFSAETGGTIEFDSKKIRVGKVEKGKVVSLAYVDDRGQVSQTIPVDKIRDDWDADNIANMLVAIAKKNAKLGGGQ